MLKASVLEGFWPAGLFKTKRPTLVKAAVKEKTSARFRFAILLIAANITLLFAYVYGVNDLASKGYVMKSLEKKHTVLVEENKKLNLTAAESGSIVSVQNGTTMANFVPAGTPRFLEIDLNHFTQR